MEVFQTGAGMLDAASHAARSCSASGPDDYGAANENVKSRERENSSGVVGGGSDPHYKQTGVLLKYDEWD